MSEHTKEPLVVIDKDPYHGTYIEDEHGDTICDLYILDEDNKPIEQNNSIANSKRIVECVNACAGISNEQLESWMLLNGGILQTIKMQTQYANELQAQNAQLVEALKGCLNMVNGDGQPPNWDGLRALLAEIEKDK